MLTLTHIFIVLFFLCQFIESQSKSQTSFSQTNFETSQFTPTLIVVVEIQTDIFQRFGIIQLSNIEILTTLNSTVTAISSRITSSIVSIAKEHRISSSLICSLNKSATSFYQMQPSSDLNSISSFGILKPTATSTNMSLFLGSGDSVCSMRLCFVLLIVGTISVAGYISV